MALARIAWLALLGAGCTASPSRATARFDAALLAEEDRVELARREPHLALFPCGAQCHEAREADPRPRRLRELHAGRTVDHGPALRWCADCHDLEDADRLRTLDGSSLSFDESDRICAQCHGEKHRDWRAGLHGLSTGGWRGTVLRRTCTACHDPHAPERITLEALPPPLRDPRIQRSVR